MVSVIIPVYNGEEYIKSCLDSLLPTSSGDSLEVIVVNDGSRDATLEILREYEIRYSNLRVVDKENGGAAQARKCGLALAGGDYVGFLDADDGADPSFYLAMEAKAIESGADIVFCDYTEVCSHKKCRVSNRLKKGQTLPMSGEEAMTYLHQREAYFPFPWNKLYRRELINEVDFPTGNFVGEDYNMHIQLLSKTDRIDYLAADGYHYMITENSVSRRGYGESTIRAYEHFQEDLAWIGAHFPKQKAAATHYVMIEYMAMIVAMGRNKTYNQEMIREIKRIVRANLGGFLGAGYVPVKMKGSAVVLAISYRLLIMIYRLIG